METKTVEHRAWDILTARLEEQRKYAGNWSENAKFRVMVKEALEKAMKEQKDGE